MGTVIKNSEAIGILFFHAQMSSLDFLTLIVLSTFEELKIHHEQKQTYSQPLWSSQFGWEGKDINPNNYKDTGTITNHGKCSEEATWVHILAEYWGEVSLIDFASVI